MRYRRTSCPAVPTMPIIPGRESLPVVYRGTVSGLRISSVDGTAFIDNLSGATLDLGSSVVNATGTAAIRISSVDGTAFVDTADATLAAALAANAGKYLIIADASGRYLKGWIKAAGDGETLGGELLEDPLFDNTDKWSEDVNWAVAGGLASATGSGSLTANENRCVTSNDVADVGISGALYKTGFNVNAYTSGSFRIDIGGTYGPAYSSLSTSDYSFYLTQGGTVKRVYLRCNGTASFNSATVKQVLAPSADGCTIVSTKGGTTYNFESKDASFTYNATSYTYTIYDRDVTALADGSHLVEIYDASGRLLRGYLAAAGDGEDAATDVLTGWNFTSGWTPSAGVTINDVDTFTTTGAGQYIYRSANPFAVGALYKVSYDSDQTAGVANLRHTSTTSIADDGDANKYWTASSVSLRIQATLSATVDVTTMTAFAVTGPSADGCTIVSAKGGATANFAYRDALFAYNSSQYYVTVRKAR